MIVFRESAFGVSTTLAGLWVYLNAGFLLTASEVWNANTYLPGQLFYSLKYASCITAAAQF